MYNWIETTFNVSGGVTQAIAVILALAAVLLLFSLFIFILKRLTGANVSQSRNRQPRIAVMDSTTVDTRRRLVLVRRDNVEHLLLIGGPSDVVVEQNIVRNAPLSARPGAQTSAGVTTPASVKAPMAPGPNIPLRPDDSIDEPAPIAPTTPIAQAAPIAPATPITQAAPIAPATPITQAAPIAPAEPIAPTVSTRLPERPVSALRTLSDQSSPAPEKATPVTLADTGSAKRPSPLGGDDTPLHSKEETAKDNGRAAELLRAAMQNGFNRTSTKSQTPDDLPEAPSALDAKEILEPTVKAPDVKPEPLAPRVTTASKTDTNTTSSLKPMARPFTPRDRPSYGGHSISPPASGPAAKAKTALLKPVETASSPKKIEPVLGKSEQQEALPDAKTPALVVSGDHSVKPPEAPLAESATERNESVDAEVKAPTDLKEPEAKAPEVKAPKPDVQEATTEAQDNAGGKDAETDEPASEHSASPDQVSGTKDQDKSKSNIKLDFDLSDIIEDDPAQSTSKISASDETPQEDAESSGDSQSQKQEQKSKSAAPGLANKNPIEDEMAKLLDELGGQPN